MGPARFHDQGPHVATVDAGTGSGLKPLHPPGLWSGQSTVEVPLRCGSVVRGWLRIRSRTRGIASLTKETIRRLTTLGVIGALCAREAGLA